MFRRLATRLFGMPLAALETPNPDCLQFRSTMEDILPGDFTCDVPLRTMAHVHPLAQMLFDQYEKEVRAVFLARSYVTVTKWSDVEWSEGLERSIGGLIGQYLLYNDPVEPDVEAGFRNVDDDVAILETDSDAVQCIKELLKKEIKPMVQRDGGDVKFLGFDAATGVVSLEMMGACKTCPSSRNTLKDGIERMMMHFVEEVKEVVEIKAHGAKEQAVERDRRTAAVVAELQESTGVAGGFKSLQDVPAPEDAKSQEEREAAIRYEEFLAGKSRDEARVDRVARQRRMRQQLGRRVMSLEELYEPDGD